MKKLLLTALAAAFLLPLTGCMAMMDGHKMEDQMMRMEKRMMHMEQMMMDMEKNPFSFRDNLTPEEMKMLERMEMKSK